MKNVWYIFFLFIVPLSALIFFFHENILVFFNATLGISLTIENLLLIYVIVLIITARFVKKKTNKNN